MDHAKFQAMADEATRESVRALNLLVEVNLLIESIKSLPENAVLAEAVEELSAKERSAVSSIRNAMNLERELLKYQEGEIEKLYFRIDK